MINPKLLEELNKRIKACKDARSAELSACNLPEIITFNELALEAMKHDGIDRDTAATLAGGVVASLCDDVNIPRLTEAVGKFCIKPAFCGCLDSKHCVLEEGSALGEGVRCRKLHSGKPVVLKGRYLGELGTFGIQKDALSEAATKAEDFLKRNKSTCR